jgi:tripartite-type tricarboxylate transporter receptor subunit TctC
MTTLVHAVAGLALTAASIVAQAQTTASGSFPTRPVRVVLGFPAGGPTDAAGRIIAQALAQPLGQTVIMDNRPGADGAIGPELVARATPDGHTLLMASGSNMAGVPAMRKNVPYDPVADFSPVVFAGWSSTLLVVNPSVQAKTLGELIAYARTNPGKLSVAAANPQTIFTMAQVKAAGKVDMLNVPYKGDVAAMPDLLSGRVHILVGGTNLVLPHVKEGRLRALAALTRNRTRPAPDVPTIVEAGVPNFSIFGWFAYFAPAKTPEAIIARLERELSIVLKRPETQEQFDKIGLETGGGPSRTELAAFVREQMRSWAAAARDAGMQPQ